MSSTLSRPRVGRNISKSGQALREDFVPSDYNEFFSHYYGYVLRLVRSMGIADGNVEDVAMSLIRTFYERDALSSYQEDYWEREGVRRRAVFRTFLSGFVAAYIPHYRDKQKKALTREPISLDASLPDAEEGDSEHTWMSQLAPVYTEEFEDVMFMDLIHRVRSHLTTVERRNKQDQCDMLLLFDLALLQSKEQGKVSTVELAEMFGVTRYSIQKWLIRLRAEVEATIRADL